VHHVEWGVGEAAGLLAAFCLSKGETPRGVRHRASLLADFQSLCRAEGVELSWPQLRPL
jgi:hypothetical protein